MRLVLSYSRAQFPFEITPESLRGSWTGPEGALAPLFESTIPAALASPLDFPPLGRTVVAGDRIVIPVVPPVPGLNAVLAAVTEILEQAGVSRSAITVLIPSAPPPEDPELVLIPGVELAYHDPGDRSRLAYLASTKAGRRVYLNRLLTDADVVLPIGRLAPDPVLRDAGPWSAIYPAMSDTATLRSFRRNGPGPGELSEGMAESMEVGWLLGAQFQIGIATSRSGPTEILAGEASAVRARGIERIEADWTDRVPAEARAEVVLAGIGTAWSGTGLGGLATGLENSLKLVRTGGKLVILSEVSGEPGRAVRRLADRDDPRSGPSILQGFEEQADYRIARSIAQAQSQADIYLLSALNPDLVDSLGIVPLESPEQAARLVARARSCQVLSPADLCRVVVDESEAA